MSANQVLVTLDLTDLALSTGAIGIAIGLSAWQSLGLEGRLALAAARTLVQLLVVGTVLQVVFAWGSPLALLAVLAFMTTVAAIAAKSRIAKRSGSLLPLVWLAIFAGGAVAVVYANAIVLRRPDLWLNPQYIIPLAGICIGNATNSAAIAGDRFTRLLAANRLQIETHLCLGATPELAVAAYRRESIRAGMLSITNSMMVVGLVTLPGVVTGQILSGVDPLVASAYQILIMFSLALADTIAVSILTAGLWRRYFNSAMQFESP
ncbi:MAG: iron export ABC transporter permease subunit FetB [Geitlerinemataceae cyanobacterium]